MQPGTELDKAIDECRALGFLRRAPAHIVFRPEHHSCPWPGCENQIRAMDFRLDAYNPAEREQFMIAWWQGSGLVGRCPGCARHILFNYKGKHRVADPVPYTGELLPDDWH